MGSYHRSYHKHRCTTNDRAHTNEPKETDDCRACRRHTTIPLDIEGSRRASVETLIGLHIRGDLSYMFIGMRAQPSVPVTLWCELVKFVRSN